MVGFHTKAALAAVVGLGLTGATTFGAEVSVGGFGQHGWYSSDTRDASGVSLLGAQNTQPFWNAAHGGSVAGDDAKIAQMIQFVDGPGGVPSVMLNATTENPGKAHLSVANLDGEFGTGASLLEESFGVSYRSYNQPVPTTRTLGISIGLVNINDPSEVYSLSHIGESEPKNTWIENAADRDSNWRLFGKGPNRTAPGGAVSKSLTAWSDDSTFADVFTSQFAIFEVGFNLGTYQRDNNTYVDWFQSSLINGGDKVNFVPEPASLGALGVGALALLARRRRTLA